MTRFEYGDVVLVPFPSTDQRNSKRRPAVVVSSAAYHQLRHDVIILAVTSRVRLEPAFAERPLLDWRTAGLLSPSVLKPVVATLFRGRILRALGSLSAGDRVSVRSELAEMLGS